MKFLHNLLWVFCFFSTQLSAQGFNSTILEVREKMIAESLEFCELTLGDFEIGFRETLAALKSMDVDDDRAAEIFKERQTQGIQSFTLKKEGRVVATAAMLLETKYYRGGHKVAHVEDVAVHPGYQGRGFGKILIACLIEEAALKGCYKIILDCSEKNVPFYEKAGFKQHELQMRLDLYD